MVSQNPPGGDQVAPDARVTLVVGRVHAARPRPDAGAAGRPVRVVVLGGGRSSEHDVSLRSSAAVADGLRAAGHDVVASTIARVGAWPHDDAALALEPGGGLLGADVVFPVLHGPFGEDGTVQGAARAARRRPTSARACWPRRCAWTRSSSRRCWPPPGCRRCDYAAVREAELADRARGGAGGAGRARPAGVRQARAARLVGRDRKVWSEAELGPSLETAFGHDGLVIVEAFSAGHGGRVLGAGQRRARGLGPGGDRAAGRRLVRLRGQVRRGRHGARRPGAGVGRGDRESCGGWRARRSCASAAPGSPGWTSSSRASRCSSTSSTRCPASPRRACSRSCGRPAACGFPELCDRLLALALERWEAERGGHGF